MQAYYFKYWKVKLSTFFFFKICKMNVCMEMMPEEFKELNRNFKKYFKNNN